MDSDEQIVQRLKSGDREAFDELYEKYHLLLYRTAYLILGNQYDAEDALQDTFVTAFLHIGDLKNAGSLKYWLVRILTNKAIRSVKRADREIPDEDVIAMADRSPAGSGDVEEEAERRIFRDEVMENLKTLSERQRAVIVLYYYDELSIAEIAGICRCFEGTVKSRLFQARKKLKISLSPQDGVKTKQEVASNE